MHSSVFSNGDAPALLGQISRLNQGHGVGFTAMKTAPVTPGISSLSYFPCVMYGSTNRYSSSVSVSAIFGGSTLLQCSFEKERE
jgi:hypothetical protein